MKILGLSGRNWKCFFAGLILAWISGCAALWTYGGVPVKFTVETSRADMFEHSCYHGETLDFEVTYKSYGKDLYIPTNYEAQIFWQTNGMSAFFWRTNTVTCISNKMYTTFLPSMDPGTSTVYGFIGVPEQLYRAAFVLRFKNSPGAKPKEMEWPYRELDFDQVQVKHAPYYLKSEVDAKDDELRIWTSNNVPIFVEQDLTGRNKIRIGENSIVGQWAEDGIAIGSGAEANDFMSLAIGKEAKAGIDGFTSSHCMAIGMESFAFAQQALALGFRSTVKSTFGIAIGDNAYIARGSGSVAIGHGALISNDVERVGKTSGWVINATAIGEYASVKRDYGVALGFGATVTNENAVVISCGEKGREYSVGDGTIKLAVEDSDPKRIYIGNTNLVEIIKCNESDPTVPKWAKQPNPPSMIAPVESVNGKTGTVELVASDVGAYSATSGNTLAQQVATQGAHLNAEDAQFVSTNYDSQVNLPEAYVRIKLQQGGTNVWQTIWEEIRRWNAFTGVGFNWQTWGGFHQWSTNILAMIGETSPKEYAFYDGVTGEVAPDGFFWISQPKIAICAGAAYQRHLDAGGAVWILESNGLVANLGGTTNGYFRISDEEGNTQFEIIKGDKQTVPAIARSVRSEQVMGVTHWFCEYAVTNALAAPTAKFSRSLSNPTWIADTEANCPCNVTWTPGVNTYTLEFWPKSTEPTMFCKSEYDRGGETRIRQAVPTEMQYIILNGTKYGLTPKTINGELVMGLTTGN